MRLSVAHSGGEVRAQVFLGLLSLSSGMSEGMVSEGSWRWTTSPSPRSVCSTQTTASCQTHPPPLPHPHLLTLPPLQPHPQQLQPTLVRWATETARTKSVPRKCNVSPKTWQKKKCSNQIFKVFPLSLLLQDNEFFCWQSADKVCIQAALQCDYHADCPHGEDEDGCGELRLAFPGHTQSSLLSWAVETILNLKLISGWNSWSLHGGTGR